MQIPVRKALPKGFNGLFQWDGEHETISVNFEAHTEYEIDAAIFFLRKVQHLLRSNVKPLPRDKSLVRFTEPESTS